MKPWVKSFLMQQHKKVMNEMKMEKETRKLSLEGFKREIESDEAIRYKLIDELNCHFGVGGLLGHKNWFKDIFGSVLADLPEEVFLQIRAMKNVLYTFTPNPGAEVKHFFFEENDNHENWDRIVIVTFPFGIIDMSAKAARGMIAHELVHVCVHSDKAISNDAMEDEADRIAMEWGFEEEIKAMREYIAEYEQETQDQS